MNSLGLHEFCGTNMKTVRQLHIIISYPDAGLGHCPEGQGPDIKHKF